MKYYVVDVFTEKTFSGNPAGICLLDEWQPDEVMQSIAMENNLSETAFLVKRGDHYDLRWFTPALEIDLCGHATMASGFILFNFVETSTSRISFHTQSGILVVEKDGDMLRMDLPSRPATKAPKYTSIGVALGTEQYEVFDSADILVVLDSEETVKQMQPNFEVLKNVKEEANKPDDSFGVIITAPGSDCDFVSRYFAPNAGVDEDPVTGRAHCVLTPYWSKRLNKTSMSARQLSKRGGYILCEDAGDRVKLGGKAVLYLEGTIIIYSSIMS